MFDIGSIQSSHVFLEAESHSHFSEALSTIIKPVLSNDRTILAAPFTWTSSLAILPLLLRLDLRHDSQLETVVP